MSQDVILGIFLSCRVFFRLCKPGRFGEHWGPRPIPSRFLARHPSVVEHSSSLGSRPGLGEMLYDDSMFV